MDLVDKPCIQCGTTLKQVTRYKKLCDICIQEKAKSKMERDNKRILEKAAKESYEKAKYHIEKYVTNEITATRIKFDEISEISSWQILRSFRGKTWRDILSMFNKEHLLKDYIKNAYLKWRDETQLDSLKTFADQDKYVSYEIIKTFGIREILDYCGRKIYRNTIEDYETNFNNVVKYYGYIPLYKEFIDQSKITIENYKKRFGFVLNAYDDIVKMYVSELDYNDYLDRKKEHRTKISKITSTMNKLLVSKEQLEIELKVIMQDFYSQYSKYPSISMFEKLSKRDKRTFEEKFNKKFKDICLDYGFDIEDKASAEYIVLTKISNILNEKCDRQKTWNWLIGINNFHLWVDGYFKQYNLAIEFDGRQHYEPVQDFGGEKAFQTLQQNDNIKDVLLPQHGIKLIRITSFEPWHDEEYLRQKLIQNSIIIKN